ncbi:hypothetical protein NDU88_002113 [Pleurodeles waltl]|uniref:Uncharacterized protein n=1 Tax=Pleurodeles waltl TaxID=8319 RepID=A0AAV7UW60_PLEWA|nr:hypothetical protein NDU88_002113 [Pleurodeles waltl]
MGKSDKTQAKLQFDRHKAGGSSGEDAGPGQAGGLGVPAGEEQDLRQIQGSVASVGTVWQNIQACWGFVIDQGRLSTLERELTQSEQEQELNADDQTLDPIQVKLTEFQDTAWAEVQHMGKYATARVYGEVETGINLGESDSSK